MNSSLVAVVAVDPDVMEAWAASEGIKVVDSTKFSLLLFFESYRSNKTFLFETVLFSRPFRNQHMVSSLFVINHYAQHKPYHIVEP